MRADMTFEQFKNETISGNAVLMQNGKCPVLASLGALQGKWKLQVIYALCIKSSLRFGELARMLKGITNAMLSNTLKELEQDGIVQRVQYNEIPPHVEYSLAEKGIDLLPVFYELARWGLKYSEGQ